MDYWLLLLGQLAAVLGLVFYYFYQKFSYWSSRGLSGPIPVPLFGNELEKLLRNQTVTEVAWYRKYGKLYGTYNEQAEPTLSVVDPHLVKQMMVKDFSSFVNRALFPGGGLTNKMLFFLEGDDWKRVRSIASPAFTSGKLRAMNALMDKCIDRLMEYLEKMATRGQPIETKVVISGFTIDVIASTAFGTETNANGDRTETNPFVEAGNEAFRFSLWRTILKHFVPTKVFVFFYKLRKMISSGAGAGEQLGFFGQLAAEVIKQRKETGAKRNDFIDLLMNAQVSEEELNQTGYGGLTASDEKEEETVPTTTTTTHSKLVKKLSDEEIIAQCVIFYIAGFETTASTISHLLFELARNPEIQDRLLEELQSELSGMKPKSDAYFDRIMSHLPYLDSVIKETLRKYPPLNRVERRVGVDGYKLGGVSLVKGQMVYVSVYGLHHDERLFPEPGRFNPDRFMPESRDLIEPYSYLPFGQGPRNCVGMRFAIQEIKMFLAKALTQYKFTPTAETPAKLAFNPIGLMSVIPFTLKVERRQ